jgi:hypothetical protein
VQGLWQAGSQSVWMKFGNNCVQGSVRDPACMTAITGCSLSIGYWFARPNVTWPTNGTVVLGNHTYTRTEGLAIWNTSNKGGMKNAKMAFLQASAIRLSMAMGLLQQLPSGLATDLATVETYLNPMPKLTATSIPANSASSAAAGAAGRIGDWISSNHCD